MEPSRHVTVRIDLARIRENAARIASATGVDVIAVVKADAYGLGARAVAEALRDLVSGFYVHDLHEAVRDQLWKLTGKPIIALLGQSPDAKDYIEQHVHPVVWDAQRASRLRRARPVLNVDTGQQRFACPAGDVGAVIAAGQIDQAMTHAATSAQVEMLRSIGAEHGIARLHAAGSSLLEHRPAWLSAVRPGLALYRDALRVSTRLVDARDSTGPAGYSRFVVPRHGVILAGYSHGLRPGVCLVNAQRRRIIEVGMQTSFVELSAGDRAGDEVGLFGDGLGPEEIAQSWGTTPHEALVRLAGAGSQRRYV
jgi:alanine racemase